MELFLSKNYRSDSIENVSLVYLWKIIYSSKMMGELPETCTFTYAYRGLVSIVAKMGLVQMRGASKILKILTYLKIFIIFQAPS